MATACRSAESALFDHDRGGGGHRHRRPTFSARAAGGGTRRGTRRLVHWSTAGWLAGLRLAAASRTRRAKFHKGGGSTTAARTPEAATAAWGGREAAQSDHKTQGSVHGWHLHHHHQACDGLRLDIDASSATTPSKPSSQSGTRREPQRNLKNDGLMPRVRAPAATAVPKVPDVPTPTGWNGCAGLADARPGGYSFHARKTRATVVDSRFDRTLAARTACMRRVPAVPAFVATKPSSRRGTGLFVACAAATLLCCGRADVAVAADAAAACDHQDVWSVSTRRLPGICRVPHSADITVERLVSSAAPAAGAAAELDDCTVPDGKGKPGRRMPRWERSDLSSLLAEPDRPLILFIHGNRYTHVDAKQQGVVLARRVAACCPELPPARTVVFSWPSEQQGILLKDSRIKFERAHADGHYMAWLLGQVEPSRPVAIVCYSFGAIVALGALDDLADAPAAHRTDLLSWRGRPGRTHLVLVAPAVRCDSLAPRGPHRDAAACIDRLTLIINSEDSALRFFHLLERDVGMPALGFVGMPRRWLPAGVEFSSNDAGNSVGKRHSMMEYLESNSMMRKICLGAGDGLGAGEWLEARMRPAADNRLDVAADSASQ